MSLSTLPDLCLITIFDRIPLLDLLSTSSLVCHRWHSLKPEACHRRRTLTIVQDGKNMKKLEQKYNSYNFAINPQTGKSYRNLAQVKSTLQNCALTLSKLTQTNCERIAELFPNVTKLSIYQKEVSINRLDQIQFLLARYSKNMRYFKLKLSEKGVLEGENENEVTRSVHENYLTSLFDAINLLVKLEDLDIILQLNFEYAQTVNLPIICQLKRLNFYVLLNDSFPSLSFPFGSLNKLCTPQNSKLENLFLSWIKYPQLLKLSPHMNPRIKSLQLWELTQIHQVNHICNNFTNLTSLSILLVSDPIPTLLLKPLAQLHNLKKLYLIILPEIAIEDADKCPVQLPAIQILKIEFIMNSHEDIGRLCVPRLFPNVQVIQFNYAQVKCSICDPGKEDQCLAMLCKPVKLCTKLRTIIWEEKHLRRDIFER